MFVVASALQMKFRLAFFAAAAALSTVGAFVPRSGLPRLVTTRLIPFNGLFGPTEAEVKVTVHKIKFMRKLVVFFGRKLFPTELTLLFS